MAHICLESETHHLWKQREQGCMCGPKSKAWGTQPPAPKLLHSQQRLIKLLQRSRLLQSRKPPGRASA